MIGKTIGPFEVVEQIAKGSLGILYRAFDKRMRREVALRLFDEDITSHQEAAMQFAFEIELASKVSHPNICNILDVGTHGHQTFVVMELLNGMSLHDRLRKEKTSIDQALDWSRQLSEAVDAIHSEGIIHGFIYPRNVFITNDNQAKLLDIGLSGLQSGIIDSILQSDAGEQHTGSEATTHAELQGGLKQSLDLQSPEFLAYQAPELLDEHQHNEVSDVFSLGCVIYEIATGVRAFPGTSPDLVIDAIKTSRPLSPTRLVPFLPISLEQQLYEMLERDPKRRMQSASQILADLQRIRRDRTSISIKTGAHIPAATSNDWPWLFACVSLIVVLAYLIWGREQQTIVVETSNAANSMEVVVPTVLPLTTDVGMELHAVISPHGNQFAYAWQGPNDVSTNIYLRLITSSEPFQLSHSDCTEQFPCWSPDGNRIAFVRVEGHISSIVVISALGGTEQVIYELDGRITSSIDWSADGQHIAFAFRDEKSIGVTELNVRNRSIRVLVSDGSLTTRFESPAYSNDNSWLAYVRRQQLGREDIFLLSRDSGESTPLTLDHAEIRGLAWCNDSQHLIASSSRSGLPTLWRFSIEPSPPTLVAGAGINATFPSIARHDNALVHTIETAEIDIVEKSFDETDGEETILIHSSRHDFAPMLSYDGKKLAFISNRTGFEEIWVADADGTNPEPVTALRQPLIGMPYWSSNNQQLLFASYHESHRDLYVVPAGGGRVIDATGPIDTAISGSFGRDSDYVYYRNEHNETYIYNRASGKRLEPPVSGMWYTRFDPFDLDGAFFVRRNSSQEFSVHRLDLRNNTSEIPILISNGKPRSLFVDQSSLYWLESDNPVTQPGIQHLWRYDRRLKDSAQVTSLTGMMPRHYGFTIGPNGNSVIYGKLSETQTDIVLIRDFE